MCFNRNLYFFINFLLKKIMYIQIVCDLQKTREVESLETLSTGPIMIGAVER